MSTKLINNGRIQPYHEFCSVCDRKIRSNCGPNLFQKCAVHTLALYVIVYEKKSSEPQVLWLQFQGYAGVLRHKPLQCFHSVINVNWWVKCCDICQSQNNILSISCLLPYPIIFAESSSFQRFICLFRSVYTQVPGLGAKTIASLFIKQQFSALFDASTSM